MAANDVTTSSSTGVPGVTPDPEKVKAPGDTGTPPVGTTPNDTPGTIQPPKDSSVTPPSIPAIGGTPEAIGGVQAPIGSQPGDVQSQDVQTLEWWDDFTNWLDKAIADSVAQNQANKEKEQAGQMGDKAAGDLARQLAQDLKAYLDKKLGAVAANDLAAINNATQDWPPKDRLLFYIDLGARIMENANQAGLKRELSEMGKVAREASAANAEAQKNGGKLGFLIRNDAKGNLYAYQPNAHLRGLVPMNGAARGLLAFESGQANKGLRNFLLSNSGFGLTDALQGALAVGGLAVALGYAGKTLMGGYNGRSMGNAGAVGVNSGNGNNILPNDAIVCRGGTCTADRFKNGSGVSIDEKGNLNGVSVNSAASKDLKQLTETIPNAQVGATTVGKIREAGGDVIPSPTSNNPYHCTLCGISPETAEGLFTPTVPNPWKGK
jgi:hypothetical protein